MNKTTKTMAFLGLAIASLGCLASEYSIHGVSLGMPADKAKAVIEDRYKDVTGYSETDDFKSNLERIDGSRLRMKVPGGFTRSGGDLGYVRIRQSAPPADPVVIGVSRVVEVAPDNRLPPERFIASMTKAFGKPLYIHKQKLPYGYEHVISWTTDQSGTPVVDYKNKLRRCIESGYGSALRASKRTTWRKAKLDISYCHSGFHYVLDVRKGYVVKYEAKLYDRGLAVKMNNQTLIYADKEADRIAAEQQAEEDARDGPAL